MRMDVPRLRIYFWAIALAKHRPIHFVHLSKEYLTLRNVCLEPLGYSGNIYCMKPLIKLLI